MHKLDKMTKERKQTALSIGGTKTETNQRLGVLKTAKLNYPLTVTMLFKSSTETVFQF